MKPSPHSPPKLPPGKESDTSRISRHIVAGAVFGCLGTLFVLLACSMIGWSIRLLPIFLYPALGFVVFLGGLIGGLVGRYIGLPFAFVKEGGIQDDFAASPPKQAMKPIESPKPSEPLESDDSHSIAPIVCLSGWAVAIASPVLIILHVAEDGKATMPILKQWGFSQNGAEGMTWMIDGMLCWLALGGVIMGTIGAIWWAVDSADRNVES